MCLTLQGALESGRDLRKLLEVIGEIDPAARIHPWTTDACLARLRAVIGEEKLETLRSARTPESDTQFVWSATTAEALILATQHLMVRMCHRLFVHPTISGFCFVALLNAETVD